MQRFNNTALNVTLPEVLTHPRATLHPAPDHVWINTPMSFESSLPQLHVVGVVCKLWSRSTTKLLYTVQVDAMKDVRCFHCVGAFLQRVLWFEPTVIAHIFNCNLNTLCQADLFIYSFIFRECLGCYFTRIRGHWEQNVSQIILLLL